MSSLIIILIIAVSAGIAGIAIGWFLRFIISLGQKGSVELEIKEMLLSAREESERITSEADKEAREILEESKSKAEELEEKFSKTEDRLIKKEALLDNRQMDIDSQAEDLRVQAEEIEKEKNKLEELINKKTEELEKITNLSKEEAKTEFIDQVKKDYEEDILVHMQKLEIANKEKTDERAREILATAIQRIATSVSSDVFTTVVNINSEEIKGKIIGKEGRNIKTLERMTGVEFIIDDTPGIITLSSYDPVRRQIAKVAMEALIEDGRIQPAKIEHFVEKAKQEVNKIMKEEGEKAAFECGVFNLDPKLMLILGRLHFRTSYGQNVLQHSKEVSHLCGILAEELGADVKVAKAGGLLHDIGKAIDHEVAGSHVEIGRRILQKFNVDETVIKAMQSHHEEYPYETVESVIVQVGDAISGSRPGARRESVENYLKRLEDLEAIANSFKGIEKSYALQAGRELRVFVEPQQISDLEATTMARDIAKRIEEDLKYPGEIKITVIRENRIIEYAR